jgi:hypothetical protein
MGLGSGGGALRGGNRFSDNVPNLISRFKLNNNGYFGTKGKGGKGTRNLDSNNPAKTAAEFSAIASKAYVSARPIPGKGTIYRMRDGGYIIYRRISSSDGSPVVELSVNNVAGIRNQKIHFTRRQNND